MGAAAGASLGGRLARASAAGLLAFVVVAGRAETVAATPPRLFTPHFVYDGTLLSVLAGGIRNGTVYVDNVHLRLSVDGEAIALPGTSAYLDLLNIHGGWPSRFVGDPQGKTNIEGPTGTVVEEFWIQHNFAASRLSLLAGLYDLAASSTGCNPQRSS
jgi:carbohydrate-selective porin OprB